MGVSSVRGRSASAHSFTDLPSVFRITLLRLLICWYPFSFFEVFVLGSLPHNTSTAVNSCIRAFAQSRRPWIVKNQVRGRLTHGERFVCFIYLQHKALNPGGKLLPVHECLDAPVDREPLHLAVAPFQKATSQERCGDEKLDDRVGPEVSVSGEAVRMTFQLLSP